MAKLPSGSRFGPYPYRIVKALDSHGGMSDIYLAVEGSIENPQAPRVVIKMSRVHREFGAFFENTIYNESERLRNLHHRGIVRILPVKMESDMRNVSYAARTQLPGEPWFLVLEYLVGGSIDDLLDKHKRLDVGSALEIARKVAETLQFLHDQNQVHLDIKPENVLFRRPIEPGSSVEPVLIDFGVSRTIGQEGLEARTLPYAPPERVQVYKESLPPETLTKPHPSMDVYSLGAVLYQMLTGKRPFEGRSNKKLSSAILEGSPTVPSQLVNALPASVDEIVLAALAKDPGQRPTAGELARRIEEVMRIERLALGLVAMGRPHTALRRNRGRGMGLAIGLAALVMMAVAVLGTGYAAGGTPKWLLNWVGSISAVSGQNNGGDGVVLSLSDQQVGDGDAIAVLPPMATSTASPTSTPTRKATSTPAKPVPTSTLAPTPPPIPSATSTDTPAATHTPRSVSTPVKALTAIPTNTLVIPAATTARAKSTPIQTRATPTRTPTATSAPTKSDGVNVPATAVGVASTAKNAVGPTKLTNALPDDGTGTKTDLMLTFSWATDLPLGPGQVFELVFWRDDESQSAARAYDDAGISTSRTFRMSNFPPGRYRWGVYLASVSPSYARLRYLGDTLSFSVSEGGAGDSRSYDSDSGGSVGK